jgi:hypothetical protein
MIAAKTMGANVATKKREIPAQQKQGNPGENYCSSRGGHHS